MKRRLSGGYACAPMDESWDGSHAPMDGGYPALSLCAPMNGGYDGSTAMLWWTETTMALCICSDETETLVAMPALRWM